MGAHARGRPAHPARRPHCDSRLPWPPRAPPSVSFLPSADAARTTTAPTSAAASGSGLHVFSRRLSIAPGLGSCRPRAARSQDGRARGRHCCWLIAARRPRPGRPSPERSHLDVLIAASPTPHCPGNSARFRRRQRRPPSDASSWPTTPAEHCRQLACCRRAPRVARMGARACAAAVVGPMPTVRRAQPGWVRAHARPPLLPVSRRARRPMGAPTLRRRRRRTPHTRTVT